MTRTRPVMFRRSRRGFTLIELLVVISIIAVLASLIAPAVQSARRAARKMECLNNMRQVGIAMQNFASATGGTLPGLSAPMNTTAGTAYTGWPVQLLPAMDNSAVLKNIRANASIVSNKITPGIGETVSLNGFTCPDDVNSHKTNGGLSYVINVGFISNTIWTGTVASPLCGTDGDPSPNSPSIQNLQTSPVTYHHPGAINWDLGGTLGTDSNINVGLATGVFIRELPAPRRGPSAGPYTVVTLNKPSLDFIGTGDGTTQTLMISENLSAGSWWDTSANQIGFGIRSNTTPVPAEFGVVAGNTSNALTTITGASGFDGSVTADPSFINRAITAPPGYAPRPSSNHVGGVNVIMCDGSGRYLQEGIDKNVYEKLITSNGVSYGEATLNQNY